MKKRIRNMTAAFLAVVMITLMIGGGIPVNASTGGHSQSDAVNWANSKVGQSLDFDGAYGAQCVDLIAYYYQYLGTSTPGGNACDYTWNALPSGWSRISNYSGFVPQAGDICVWGSYSKISAGYTLTQYGHIGIVISGNASTFNSVEQNVSGQYTQTCSNRGTGYVTCFIRPDFVSGEENPQGYLESAVASAPNKLTIKGWAYDKDNVNQSIYVDIYAFQKRIARITANKFREDVGKKYGVGNYHGFEETITMPQNGTYNIAIYAINIEGGKDTEIYYHSVTIPNYPQGEVESVTASAPDCITIKGWAFDKDDINSSVYVDIYAFKNRVARITADKLREDIGNKYGVGNYHGFEETIHMPQNGTYNIAVYAMNIGEGKETEIYYQSITVPNYPMGEVESVVSTSPNKLTIKGWAFDKDDINASVYVDIYAFRNRVARITADKLREDIGNEYGVGNYHGFEETIEMPQSGTYNIAVYAMNIGDGKETNIYYDSVDVLIEKEYTIADTNLDGRIDVRDVTALQRHVAKVNILTEEQLDVADTNGDGEVNIKDATHLQRFLAEFDVNLG